MSSKRDPQWPKSVRIRREAISRIGEVLSQVVFPDSQAMIESCLNCQHFNEAGELCKLANPPQRPPARVIAFGCDEFADNDLIPY